MRPSALFPVLASFLLACPPAVLCRNLGLFFARAQDDASPTALYSQDYASTEPGAAATGESSAVATFALAPTSPDVELQTSVVSVPGSSPAPVVVIVVITTPSSPAAIPTAGSGGGSGSGSGGGGGGGGGDVGAAISSAVSISHIPAPTGVDACGSNDNAMLVSPLNWLQYGIDAAFRCWWQDSLPPADSSLAVSQVLGKIFGNVNFVCGVGAPSTCVAPSCTDVLGRGHPAWSYFVANAFVQFSELMNNMVTGLDAAESQLNSLIPNLATIFATPTPAQDSSSDVLPWVATAVGSVLAFIPIIGPLLELGEVTTAILGGVGATAGLLVSGGLGSIDSSGLTGGSNALQDLSDIGLTIHDDFHNASAALRAWSTTLLDGKPDTTNRTLLDYFENGRFALGGTPQQVGDYFFQQALARLANVEWTAQKPVGASDVRAFVMCANATDVPCRNVSRSAVGERSCCLYGLDPGSAEYKDPPGFAELTAPASAGGHYALPPANISASALQSYLRGGFAYNSSSSGGIGGDADDIAAQEAAVRADPRAQAFLQGASAPGVFTLPVCDVVNASWVADYDARLLPCCCGPDCAETQAFANAAGLNGSSAYKDACKAQYPAFSVEGAAAATIARSLSGPLIALGAGWILLWMGDVI